MIRLFTIGFTKKSAEQFFTLLRINNVKRLIDVRLNSNGQLSGFAKGNDLAFFAKELCSIPYVHIEDFAPTKELLDSWHKHQILWPDYEKIYTSLLKDRNILKKYGVKQFDGACFLCSEDLPEQCHRRLLVEYMKRSSLEEVDIVHLT